MAVQYNISNEYLQQFDLSLGVSAVQKLSKFAYLQQLNYNAMLESLKENFLSLSDWAEQIAMYSSASSLLAGSYSVIKPIVDKNLQMSTKIIEFGDLGKVGIPLTQVQGFDKVFNISDQELANQTAIQNKSNGISID